MNIPLRRQLGISFGILVLAVILVSVISLSALRKTNNRFGAYVDDIAYREAIMNRLVDAVKDTSLNTYGLVLVSEPQDIEAGKQRVSAARERTKDALRQFNEAIAATPEASVEDRAFVEKLGRQITAFEATAWDVVQLSLAEKKAQALDTMNRETKPRVQELFTTAQSYLNESGKQAAASVEAAKSLYSTSVRVLIVTGVLSALGAVALGWAITRSVFASLGAEPADLGQAVSRVAAGDLRKVRAADAAPEGSVLSNIGKMQKQLHGLIDAVEQSTHSIVRATAEIADGNLDLSNRTEIQAASLEETAATTDELTSTVRTTAERAQQGMRLSTDASEVAKRSGETVDRVIETMRKIIDSSNQVSQIISVIEGIAFQTNILALNAAVEAARAGEQGRGFAVVASEVRNLAHRSATASKEIKHLIDQSMAAVDAGSNLVDEAGSTMREIVSAVRSVTDLMSDIAKAAHEQRLGIEQVNETVTQMDNATQQNAALVEQSAAAAESLKLQALALQQAVAVFETETREIA